MSFIFACLPDSHRALYDWFNYLEGSGEVKTWETRQWDKRFRDHYRYVNQIRLCLVMEQKTTLRLKSLPGQGFSL